ncbi:MAG: VapA/VapB family virulence-associated protein [Bacteroidia bacterium]
MNNKSAQISKETLANDYREQMKGKLNDAVIQKHVESLTASSLTAYPATGSIAGLVICDICKCTITATGQEFSGTAWGISTPGGGFLAGDVWTSDLNGLIANTSSFQLVATPVYTAFVFYDSNGNSLGSFQAGSVSTIAATAGGSGSWS